MILSMTDKPPSWPEIPPRVAAVLEPELPGLAEEILATIAREVPEYARPFEGSFGRGIRIGVNEALSRFAALIEDPQSGGGPGSEVYFELGRGELRQGRSLDSLQAAYRVGARVAWQRISRAGEAAGLEPSVLYALAEAIFAYIDELSAESVEGYAAEQSAREGAREVRRGRLLAALAQDPAVEAAELERLAGEADWPLPAEVAALICGPGRASRIARRLPVDAPAGRIEGLGCLVLPDPDGPGVRAALTGACGDEAAALGPTVRPAAFARSLSEARATWGAMEQGAVAMEPGAGPLRSDEHLIDLVLHAGRPRLERLAARLLAPLEEETPASRDRLVETLASHLRHQGRVAPVAAELHVHPQTVRYRVNRLRELLGEQLDDPDARFALEAAIRSGQGSYHSVT